MAGEQHQEYHVFFLFANSQWSEWVRSSANLDFLFLVLGVIGLDSLSSFSGVSNIDDFGGSTKDV